MKTSKEMEERKGGGGGDNGREVTYFEFNSFYFKFQYTVSTSYGTWKTKGKKLLRFFGTSSGRPCSTLTVKVEI